MMNLSGLCIVTVKPAKGSLAILSEARLVRVRLNCYLPLPHFGYNLSKKSPTQMLTRLLNNHDIVDLDKRCVCIRMADTLLLVK